MNDPRLITAIAFLVFAGGAFLGVRLLEFLVKLRGGGGTEIVPFDDRMVGVLAVISGFVGADNLSQGVALPALIIVGLVCIVLDYACCADLRDGRVPVLVGLPIALAAGGFDIVNRDLISLAAGLLIAAPFAIASFTTKGRSGGFGDAGIAALGGFALGAELGILAVAIACFAAAGTGFALKRQGGTIPFAPFLALTLQIALFVPAMRAF